MLHQEAPEFKVELPESGEGGSGKGSVSTFIVSIAAVVVTALVGVLGIINTRNSQIYDQEKGEREFRLGCVSSAATVATMAFALSKDFRSMDDEEKINQVNIIIASFPPDTASRFLGALAPRMGNAQSVIRTFQVAQDNSAAQLEAEQRLRCPSAPQLIGSSQAPYESNLGAPSPAPMAPAPEPAMAPARAADPSAVLPAPPPSPSPAEPQVLTIYYQVTQAEDAGDARRLAKDVAAASAAPGAAASFLAAGVEVVPAARPLRMTEIRYYKLDQADAAHDLLKQLAGAAQAKNLNLDPKVLYIGARYPNLPPGRMEVWFQPLNPAH